MLPPNSRRHLLQGRHKGLELAGRVLHVEEACEGVVEGGARPRIGRLGQERKVFRRVVAQDVDDRIQLEQQLAAHVADRQFLRVWCFVEVWGNRVWESGRRHLCPAWHLLPAPARLTYNLIVEIFLTVEVNQAKLEQQVAADIAYHELVAKACYYESSLSSLLIK